MFRIRPELGLSQTCGSSTKFTHLNFPYARDCSHARYLHRFSDSITMQNFHPFPARVTSTLKRMTVKPPVVVLPGARYTLRLWFGARDKAW